MKKIKNLIVLFVLFFNIKLMATDISKSVKKFDWNGIEVTWVQDERLPLYQFLVYFADGALSDTEGKYGTTNAMFELLDSGTRRYSQKDISENLEFFGVEYGGNVTHEYSTYAVSGLVKDIIPTMKQICHLFKGASFPEQEIKKEVDLAASNIESMVNNHGSLASYIFREVSLQGGPYSYPAAGKLKDLKRLNQKVLREKLDYFNQKVKKKIYISGPERSLVIKDIINEECGWKGSEASFERHEDYKNVAREKPRFIFVAVPKANQAQIRIGRFLNKEEITNPALLDLTSDFLGGGFTSLLMRAVRYNEGLTYSVNAFAAGQKEYGRSAVSTFTKNQTLQKLVEVVKDTLEKAGKKDFSQEDFERMKGHLIGGHLFSFEKTSAFLNELAMLDHSGKPYSYLNNYPDIVKKFSAEDTAKMADQIFNWNKQTILILGDESLKKQILQITPEVEVRKYQDFL